MSIRIGSTVLLLNGLCYQSYEWNKFRPLGELQRVIDSLEEYQCDEIAILRPVRKLDNLELFKKDIDILRDVTCMTPLSFGGGLRSVEHINLLHGLPIERLIFSSAFISKDVELIQYARNIFGHQAIQCLIPFKVEKNKIKVFFSNFDEYTPIEKIDIEFIDEYANEVIFVDTKNEGIKDKFNASILDNLTLDRGKVVISGGVGKASIRLAKDKDIASVLIDNRVLHSEYSIKGYKNV